MKKQNEKELEENDITLGMLLRRLRKDADLGQEEVSKILGIQRVTCSAYENDRIVPPPDKLYKLAKFYDINVERLLSKTLLNSNETNCKSEFRVSAEEAKQIDEFLYLYKNLSDSHKKVVYDLVKGLYKG